MLWCGAKAKPAEIYSVISKKFEPILEKSFFFKRATKRCNENRATNENENRATNLLTTNRICADD